MRPLGWIPLTLIAAGVACSAFDPAVGSEQDSCGLDASSLAAAGQGPYGSSAGAGAAPSTAPLCSPDAGSACDDCESQFCCTTRLACYEDPVCACADHALDACVDTAGEDATRIDACWSAFTRGGAVESARVACQRMWCAAACAAP